jgi:hypothetical protein
LRFYAGGMNGRCVLVYALAPEGATAREANGRLNEYVADRFDYLAAGEPVDLRFCWQGRKP